MDVYYRKQDIYQWIASKLRGLANWVGEFHLRRILNNIKSLGYSEKAEISPELPPHLEKSYCDSHCKHNYEDSPVWNKLVAGVEVELRDCQGNWNKYVLEDLYTKKVYCMISYYEGNLRFKN